MRESSQKIVILVNSDWFFLMHIFPIINTIKKKGVEVFVMTTNTGKKQEIIDLGFHFLNIKIDRKGANPFDEFLMLRKIYNTYKKIKPDLVHHITIKPIIYGAIVSKFLNIKTINTVCGLGYSFINPLNDFKGFIAFLGYRKALKYKKSYSFFENKNDRAFFIDKKIILPNIRNIVVNGVGANLEKYFPIESKIYNKDKIVVTLASRMLWEKGVEEFVEASKILYAKYNEKVEFRLYGKIDQGNPGSIPREYLESIEIVGFLKWYGFERDMVSVFKKSDIVVLPSFYGEGCPMVLMEACAMGLSIVTTDSVGCRECVDDGVNGFKIPIKSVDSLVNALEKLILNKELRLKMGVASRKKAEKDFDQNHIIEQYLTVYSEMLDE